MRKEGVGGGDGGEPEDGAYDGGDPYAHCGRRPVARVSRAHHGQRAARLGSGLLVRVGVRVGVRVRVRVS